MTIDMFWSYMHGIHGTSWTNKFALIGRDGMDRGTQNAKAVWSHDLAAFLDDDRVMRYALDNMDPKFPPSSLEFKALCRMAPKKEVPVLECKLTPEQIERNKQRVAEMIAGLMKAKSL